MIDNVILFYVGAVGVAGAAMIAYSILAADRVDLLGLTGFCLAAAAAERFKLAVSSDAPVAISLSLAVMLAAIPPFGVLGAALCGLSAGLAAGLLRRPRPQLRKTVFNSGLFVLAGGSAAIAYHRLAPVHAGRLDLNDAVASGAALVVYFLVAWPLLMGIVYLTTGRPIRQVWAEDFRWMPVQIVVSAVIGFTAGAAFEIFSWVGVIVYVTPLLAVREAMRQYTSHVARQMDELRQAHAEADEANRKLTKLNRDLDVTNEGLLKTLASVIDARDIYLYGHSVQASKYAGEVARIMGLDEEQVRVTELGALLHDLGKIGVSEAILNKPARLTDDEYEEIKSHCEIGYHLLSNLPQFEEVAEIVYSHHEEYDGTGYPRRLKGEEIHIGARIVSVVEATEAMISDRPYRRGMTPDEVLRELADGAGTQWDPEVVRIFSGMLSADRKHLKMRNSALEIALSRTPIADLVTDDGAAPSLEGVTATFHGALQPIFILDQDYAVVAANPAAERVTGYTEAQLQERTWQELVGTDRFQREAGHNFFSSARLVDVRRAGGDAVSLEVTGTPLRTNSASYWMVLAGEVDARQRRGGTGNDALTGVMSAEAFEATVRAALDDGVEPLALAVIDIDGMGAVNETFGHEVGDQALRVLARTLRAQLRQGDVAGRVAGDRFAVLMRRATMQDTGRVMQRLEDALPAAAEAFDLDCVVEFCTGAAQWNGHEGYEELMARAALWLQAERRSRRPGGSVVAMPIGGHRRRPNAAGAESAAEAL